MHRNQQVLNLPSKTTYDHADFYVSSSNVLAYRWIESWPTWPNHCLILFGPLGCGKTHLAHIWKQKTGALIIPFQDLAFKNLDDLCQKHKNIIVEDIPEIFDENILFHLYNSAQQAAGTLLLTANASPSNWNISLPDLKSRLKAAMCAEIKPADDELLKAMMRKIFSDEQIKVQDQIINYLLNHQERSFNALFNTIKTLNTHALATKRKITLPLVKEVLLR